VALKLAHRDVAIRRQFIDALREAIQALEATAQSLEEVSPAGDNGRG
jgi:hypothetical protein